VDSALDVPAHTKQTPFAKSLPLETLHCAAPSRQTPTPSWQLERSPRLGDPLQHVSDSSEGEGAISEGQF